MSVTLVYIKEAVDSYVTCNKLPSIKQFSQAVLLNHSFPLECFYGIGAKEQYQIEGDDFNPYDGGRKRRRRL